MATRCKTCGGVYRPIQADGSRYFHACAPVANPRFQPDPLLPAFDPTPTIERANRRDENPPGTVEIERGKPAPPERVKAEGAGVEDVP